MGTKKLISIFIFICLCGCSKSQYHYYHLLKNGVTSHVTPGTKNIQALVDSPAYEAFGIPVQNQDNQVTYYYRRGSTHVLGGNPAYRTLNIAAGIWSNPVIIATDSLDCRDISGGHMDNDSNVIFYARNHTDVYHSRDLYIQKCDRNNNFSARVLFNWTGITQLQSGFFWGPMVTGDSPGEYFHILYQLNGDTGATRYRISFMKTTDYWNHYSEQGVLFDSTLDYTETAVVKLGGGKFLGITRKNNSGALIPFESSDNGVTWGRRTASNLYWYNSGGPSIPYVYAHDGVFDIPYQNRDASMIEISKGNTVASFGTSTFNEQEIYSYHRGVGLNPSLGYVSEIKLTNGRYLLIYSKEYSGFKANIQWTYDDLVTDPGGIPAAPTLATSGIGTTTFRVDVTGYSDADWQNVRYMSFDMSTHADFSDFVTARYRSTGTYPSVELHNIRMTGYWDIYNSLTTGTTYYLRIKSCNNAGCSAYSTVNITTL